MVASGSGRGRRSFDARGVDPATAGTARAVPRAQPGPGFPVGTPRGAGTGLDGSGPVPDRETAPQTPLLLPTPTPPSTRKHRTPSGPAANRPPIPVPGRLARVGPGASPGNGGRSVDTRRGPP